MISELFELLSAFDVKKGKNQKFAVNLNKNRIRSISAYSSNTIFYFPTIVSDQTMPEEQAMIIRMVEKAYASFVVACISLMPFHRIKADDKASIEDYLRQFHQNIGMNQGSGPILNKVFAEIDTMDISESVKSLDGFEETQKFLEECWKRSLSEHTDFVKIIAETVSLNDMFNEDAIDHKTQVLQAQFRAQMEERDTWGFIGEATDDLLDGDMDELLDMTDEQIEQSCEEQFSEEHQMDEYLSGYGEEDLNESASFDDLYEKEAKRAKGSQYKTFGAKFDNPVGAVNTLAPSIGLTKLLKKASTDEEISKVEALVKRYDFDDTLNKSFATEIEKRRKAIGSKSSSITEGTVKSAVDSIKFSLESVSANKIMSCQSLTKLASLESKLNKLKNKYTKYLNRYKRKVKENKEKGEQKTLSIRFNGFQISNPKAFMKQYGTYIKIINKRLKLVEKRRAELRKRKGLPAESQKLEESAITDLTQMDFDAIDYCIKTIDESLNAPDSEIFIMTEALSPEQKAHNQLVIDKLKAEQKGREYLKQAQSKSKENDELRMKAEQRGRRVHELEKENEHLKTNAEKNNPSAESEDYGRPQNAIIPGRGRGNRDVKVFDKELFTDMDVKKANEAIPMFTKATISFIVDDTEEVVARDVLVGVKAYIHKAPANELVNDVYNCIINKRKFLRFVKFVTGEERSLSDLLFGFKELKADALDARSGAGEWRGAFKRRRRWAKMSVPYLMKEYTPNGTLVMTMNEVNFIRDQYGIDIMKPDHVRMIMDADFLLGFVIIDQAEEMVYVTYDGHGYGFQQYTYAMLEREHQRSDREMRELYRSIAGSR